MIATSLRIVRRILLAFCLTLLSVCKTYTAPIELKNIYPYQNPRKVYLAGPLFNQVERSQMTEIAKTLEKSGFETFLPHRDGLEFAKILPTLQKRFGADSDQASNLILEAIFDLDTYQVIVECGALVFNANGRVPDEGAVSETAMAWVLGKPAVSFSDDARSIVGGKVNVLITGITEYVKVSRYDDIPIVLKDLIDRRNLKASTRVRLPESVSAHVTRGKAIWKLVNFLRTSDASAEKTQKQLGELLVGLYARPCKQSLPQLSKARMPLK